MRHFLVLLAAVLSVLALYFLHANRFKIWYDESAQLSISHGSHPETLQPYAYGADVGTVLSLNQRFEFDPGGYTLFLTLLGPLVRNHFVVYRLISEVAYLGGLVLILLFLLRPFARFRPSHILMGVAGYLLLLLLSRSVLKQLTGLSGQVLDQAFMLLPFSTMVRSAFFIRPYGLEVLFIGFILYLGDWYRKDRIRAYIAPALAFLVGIVLTRYDFLMFSLCYALAVALRELSHGRFMALLRSPGVWLVASAVLAGAGLVYTIGYAKQFGSDTTPYRLDYLGRSYLVSAENWRFFIGIPKNLLACAMMAVVVFGIARRRFGMLECAYASVFLFYLTLSVLGFYPFNFSLAQCTSMIVLMDALMLKWLFGLLSSTAVAEGRLGRSLRLFSTGLGRYGWMPLLALSALVVGREFRAKGGEALVHSMVADREEDPLKFNRRIDTILTSRPDARVFLDWLAASNVNCFYVLSGRPLPRNTYVCESIGSLYTMNESKPGYAERVETAVRADCDIYYIPELNFGDSVAARFSDLGYVQAFPNIFVRNPK